MSKEINELKEWFQHYKERANSNKSKTVKMIIPILREFENLLLLIEKKYNECNENKE